jgi:non-ribosomal peptide synthetase component F
LAHYLRRKGVGLEVRVGVLLERSLEFDVALLAILKAGGTYVPLDATIPRDVCSSCWKMRCDCF